MKPEKEEISLPEKKKYSLCVECKYLGTIGRNISDRKCYAPTAPPTDFVTGEKDPYIMNKYGSCYYYTEK